MHNFFIVFSQP